MIVDFQRVSTTKIGRNCGGSVDKEKPWRRPDVRTHLSARKLESVFGGLRLQQSNARVLVDLDIADGTHGDLRSRTSICFQPLTDSQLSVVCDSLFADSGRAVDPFYKP